MRAFPVLLTVAVILAVLIPAGVASATSPTSVTVQLNGTATQTLQQKQVMTQTGNGQYQLTGSILSFSSPGNLSVYGATSIGAFSILFNAQVNTSAHGLVTPVLNIAQGTTVFVNGTVLPQVLVSPKVSTTAVSEKVVSLFEGNGGVVPAGGSPYTVFVNTTATAAVQLNLPETWVQNSSTLSLNVSVTPPLGMSLNQTTVFFPFPTGVSLNYSSVNVYLGKTLQIAQVAEGGVYLYVSSIAPGSTDFVNVFVHPLPTQAGPAPEMRLTNYTSVANGYYQAGASTTNTRVVSAYNGIFLFDTSFTAPWGGTGYIDPNTLTIWANGRVVSNSSIAISGTTITILPLVLIVNAGVTEVFQIQFKFLSTPPIGQIYRSSGFLSYGGATITWGELLAGLAAVTLISLVAYVADSTRSKRRAGSMAVATGNRRYRNIWSHLDATQRRITALLVVVFVGLLGILVVMKP